MPLPEKVLTQIAKSPENAISDGTETDRQIGITLYARSTILSMRERGGGGGGGGVIRLVQPAKTQTSLCIHTAWSVFNDQNLGPDHVGQAAEWVTKTSTHAVLPDVHVSGSLRETSAKELQT